MEDKTRIMFDLILTLSQVSRGQTYLPRSRHLRDTSAANCE
jgi:hypothetical protein